PSTFLLGPFLYFCVLPSTPGSHRHPHPPPPPLLLLIDNPLEAFSGPRRNLGSQLFLSGEPVEALQSFSGFGVLLCSNRWVFSSRQSPNLLSEAIAALSSPVFRDCCLNDHRVELLQPSIFLRP
ncbi:hypothetical protein BHE90_016849, partial [Fusarium euwallaceae]